MRSVEKATSTLKETNLVILSELSFLSLQHMLTSFVDGWTSLAKAMATPSNTYAFHASKR